MFCGLIFTLLKFMNAKIAVFSDTNKLLKRKLCGGGENLMSERTRYATGACGLTRFMGALGLYIRICLGVLRTPGLYINFRQSAINDHQCCVLAHASPLSVLKHALGRKWSLMATPSKRDSVNAQSSFKFRSVDSQTISFLL